jgi:glycosyltransferase EpsH
MDIEIICINDGSSDKSLAILKKYAQRDNRVKIIDFKKNQGVSVARNSGMKIAKGEYIGFCDPDDYVDLDFYEKLYKLAKSKNADIAKANYKIMKIDASTEIVEVNNINRKIPKYKGYFTHPFWTSIYRSKMLKKHKIKFPIGIIANQDTCFLTHATITAKNVCALNSTFYHYVRRANSANSVTYSSEKMNSVLRSFCIILDRLNEAIKNDNHYICIYALSFYGLLNLLVRNSEERFIKKVAKISIAYYQKCSFPKKLYLPRFIIAALENKNAKELIFLLRKWVNNEFYPMIDIKESILQNCSLYVWGTGEDGIKVKKQCERNGWKIVGFLDSNKSVKEYNGYKVKRPEQILNKSNRNFFIIISSRKYSKEIAGICRKAGLKRNENFWSPN